MSAHPKAPVVSQCPWCGLWEIVPHRSDAACIAALRDAIKLHNPAFVRPTMPIGGSRFPDTGAAGLSKLSPGLRIGWPRRSS